MTEEEKLKALIRKSVDGGWDRHGYDEARVTSTGEVYFHNNCDEHGPEDFSRDYRFVELIFDHEFVKALFGEEFTPMGYPFDGMILTDSDYHLMQTVIIPTVQGRIDYMYGAVFGGEEKP